MYFYVINHIETPADVRLVVITMLVCMSVEGAFMVLQYFTGVSLDIGGLVTSEYYVEGAGGGAGVTGARVSGTFPDPGSAALFLNSFLPLAFGIFLIGKPAYRGLALAALSIGFVALIATSSRAGWISFAIAMAVFLARTMWTKVGQRAILIALVGVLLVGVAFGVQIQQRLVTIATDQTRAQLAETAFNIIRAYPLGVGDNTYIMHLSDEYLHPELVGSSVGRQQPHNTYLLLWAELGIHGLIIFIWLLLAAALQSRSWLRNTEAPLDIVILGASFLAGLVAHITHMLSESFHARNEVYLLWLVIAMMVVINRLATQGEVTHIFTDDKERDWHALSTPSRSEEIR
jgi:O-antigen ligase